MITSFYNHKSAKLKFFALYGFSVALIVILFFSLFGATVPEVRRSSLPVTVTTESDNAHQYLLKLGRSFAQTVAASGSENDFGQQQELLKQQLDSARQLAALIEEAGQRQAVESAIDVYAKGIRHYSDVLQTSSAQHDTVFVNAGATKAVLQDVQNQLAQKAAQLTALEQQKQALIAERDKTIALLRNQLAAKQMAPAVVAATSTTAGDAAALRKKAEDLKAQNEKYLSQINSLKESYKQVVDDNRRLLTKLEELRSGRNGQR